MAVVICCCGEEKAADHQPRGCTDGPCFFLFVLCVLAELALLSYGFKHGDARRFVGLPDHQGQFCGVSAAVETKPYLYFCKDATGHINWTSPMCRESCPDPLPGSPTQTLCPHGMSEDYPTRIWAGELCLPKDGILLEEVQKELHKHTAVNILLEIAEVRKAWPIVAISAVGSIMLAFTYLFFLEQLTFCLLWSSVAVLVLTPGMIGVTAIYVSQEGGFDHLPGTGDSTWDLAIGIAFCVTSFCFMCLACCKASSVNLAVDCIRATCECIRDMPTMLFEPVVSLCAKVPMLITLVVGFMFLISCVHQAKHAVYTSTGMVEYMAMEYSPDTYAFLTFYVFTGIWIMETFSALSHFAISYATQQWFFSHHRPSSGLPRTAPTCAACRGLCVGLTYHLGTLAFGSFILSLVRVPRLILAVLVGGARGSDMNPAVVIMGNICACCLACFDRFLRFLTKNAYMDVAITGSDFCKAAHRAMLVLQSEATAVAVLNGATWLFQLTGLGSIASAGAAFTFFMVTELKVYGDSASVYYIPDPLFLCGTSFVLCFLVALPFMLVFDQVSDTILFCYASESASGTFTLGGGQGKDNAPLKRPETQALLMQAGSERVLMR